MRQMKKLKMTLIELSNVVANQNATLQALGILLINLTSQLTRIG
tara:strand:- start:570 stop:701 length:132 start_codon:yes stop_codon:yes gene_type:complete